MNYIKALKHRLHPLVEADILVVLKIALRCNYPLSTEDLMTWNKHDPAGINVAGLDSGELIGLGAVLNHNDKHSFGGTFIVHEKYRTMKVFHQYRRFSDLQTALARLRSGHLRGMTFGKVFLYLSLLSPCFYCSSPGLLGHFPEACLVGKTSKEAYAILVRVHEDLALSIKFVHKWFARFRDGWKSVSDKTHNERLLTFASDDNMEKMRKLITKDHRLTARMIADELQNNSTTNRYPVFRDEENTHTHGGDEGYDPSTHIKVHVFLPNVHNAHPHIANIFKQFLSK
ncbi:uncharacterized protein TNCV_4912991 [Trichonephila clavipes]|nr:uncharacterized protein TNCV_4912991 [Trichonephila clavipes]